MIWYQFKQSSKINSTISLAYIYWGYKYTLVPVYFCLCDSLVLDIESMQMNI